MTTAPKLANQCIKTYAAVKAVEQRLQEKLDKLVEARPFYQLFDGVQDHPYALLPSLGQQLNQTFLNLYVGIAGWDVDGRTIADEVDKIKARQIVEGSDNDLNVETLNQLTACAVSVQQAAQQIISLFKQATWIWSSCDNKTLKTALVAKFGKKGVENNAEVPLLNIAPDSKKAVKEVKALAKLLRSVGDGTKTTRDELEQLQMVNVRNTNMPDTVITHLLK